MLFMEDLVCIFEWALISGPHAMTIVQICSEIYVGKKVIFT